MTPSIDTYSFKSGLSQELELVDIADLYRASNKIITKPHRAGFYVILFVESGNSKHFIDFNPIELTSNTIVFFHKDIVQQFDKNLNLKGKAILFTDAFFMETIQDAKFLNSTILFNNLVEISKVKKNDKIKYFETTYLQMAEELKHEKDSAQKLILKNLLHNFLLVAEREIKNTEFNRLNNIDLDHIILFKNQIESNFNQRKSVAFFAEKMGLSEKRLNQASKKILGKTAKKIIDDRVVLEAKRLLVNTPESVKEIGFQLGFDEPTYFIQYFKKHVLDTPAEFRKKYALA